MQSQHFKLIVLLAIVLSLASVGCEMIEPVEFAGLTAHTEYQVVYEEQTQQVCDALENAGYIMPYGSSLSWFKFNIRQAHWMLEGSNNLIAAIPYGKPYLYILVDWNIPADLNMLPDAVSQETVDVLAGEAQNICQIVQQEAQQVGIGPINVTVSLRDLFAGLTIDYGVHTAQGLGATSDCGQIVGAYIGHSLGSHPQDRTPGMCPSLYVEP